MDLSGNNLGSSKLLETIVIYRLNTEDFSNFFLFDLDLDFFRPFRGFSFKVCTVSYSHVICTNRFAIKYHIGLSLFGRWGRLGKIGFILVKNGILQGLKLVSTYAIENFIEISRIEFSRNQVKNLLLLDLYTFRFDQKELVRSEPYRRKKKTQS